MNRLPSSSFWTLPRVLTTLGRDGSAALPTAPRAWQAQALVEADWRRYAQALGYPTSAEPPLCYHYLALQRAQLQHMLASDFPHPVAGMVHVEQTLAQRGPWQLAAPWQLRASVQPAVGRHDAQQLRWHAEFLQEGQVVLSAESLYLVRRAHAKPRTGSSARVPAAPAAPPGEPLAEWPLPAHAGRRYARLSGDWNPIHLWPWSARLLGQARPIIHGMHSAARCEAELSRHLGRPLQSLAIRFKRPLALPGHAVLCANDGGFSLFDDQFQVVAGGEFS